MNILFMTHYFPPESNAPANRVSDMARYWVSKGHQVTIITNHPNHRMGGIYDGYENKPYSWDEWNGVRVLRVWTMTREKYTTATQTLSYLVYMGLASTAAALIQDADVVIATSPHFFCGLGGTVMAKLLRRKMIVEIRDLWPESFNAVGVVENKLLLDSLEQLELWMYRNAGRIVVVTDSFKTNMVDRGIDPDKIDVIFNGIDSQHFSPDAIEPLPRAELGLEGKFVVSYIGTIGRGQNLPSILRVMKNCERYPDIAFVIMGGGAELELLQMTAGSLGLTNLQILGHQPAKRAKGLLAATDLSLVHLRKSDVFKKVIPSKMFESMGMKKPVILGVEGESARILRESEAGIAVEPENVEMHTEAILELYKNRALREQMGENGRKAVVEKYDRRHLAQRYLEIMQRFTGCS